MLINGIEYRLVPVEAQPEMLAATLPDTVGVEAASEIDRKTVVQALFLLGDTKLEGDGVVVALGLLRDYQLMVAAAPRPDIEALVEGVTDLVAECYHVDMQTDDIARSVLRHLFAEG